MHNVENETGYESVLLPMKLSLCTVRFDIWRTVITKATYCDEMDQNFFSFSFFRLIKPLPAIVEDEEFTC